MCQRPLNAGNAIQPSTNFPFSSFGLSARVRPACLAATFANRLICGDVAQAAGAALKHVIALPADRRPQTHILTARGACQCDITSRHAALANDGTIFRVGRCL